MGQHYTHFLAVLKPVGITDLCGVLVFNEANSELADLVAALGDFDTAAADGFAAAEAGLAAAAFGAAAGAEPNPAFLEALHNGSFQTLLLLLLPTTRLSMPYTRKVKQTYSLVFWSSLRTVLPWATPNTDGSARQSRTLALVVHARAASKQQAVTHGAFLDLLLQCHQVVLPFPHEGFPSHCTPYTGETTTTQ
jgi:hypothetical protein